VDADAWIDDRAAPTDDLDSLAGVVWHAADAWARRNEPNVVLVHYVDLSTDLDREMRRLASRLGIVVPEATWPSLVTAASFERMRERADELAPAPPGLFKDRTAFFRRGGSDSATAILDRKALTHYHARVAELARPDVVAWLHGGTGG
jgi:hypothetical protein